MSISASLSHAISGLTASSRAAEVVSSNVANAMTEGYARRELELSARVSGSAGSGVQIDGVRRVVDEATIRERRLAGADLASAKTKGDYYDDLLRLLGEPDEPGNLSGLQANFAASLLEAVSRPDSEPRLAAVTTDATAYVRKINDIGDGIQALREDADSAIGTEVQRLNRTLEQIADLNSEILSRNGPNASRASLFDHRQSLIDDISDLVPVRQLQRDNGAVALYSMGGTLLLDATPAKFEFRSTAPITADMTLQSGALSGLSVDGRPIVATGENAPIRGGRLAALFDIRDTVAPQSQANIDDLARDLVSRFEAPGPDTTIAPGDPGLFTDAGAALDPTNVEGLSSRLSLNALVDPAAGGAIWRLRDGLGAPAPGAVGDSSRLSAYIAVASEARSPVGGSLGTAARSLSDFSASVLSDAGQAYAAHHAQVSYSTARFDTLRDEELSRGVDTDQEMQKLLLIEQAYAANARVIQTVDQLIQTLIGL